MRSANTPKIVLTGAPSSGKSSVMKALASAYAGRVTLVPESAAVLLGGGFPKPAHDDIEQIRSFQSAVLQVQAGLEFILAQQNKKSDFMVCDRASLDGGGFWPKGPTDFLNHFDVDKKREFNKFTHVVFLELPGREMFGGVNHRRFHDFEQSMLSERQLESIWSDHPAFTKIAAQPTIEAKVEAALAKIKEIVG